jgi:hypothetical protein
LGLPAEPSPFDEQPAVIATAARPHPNAWNACLPRRNIAKTPTIPLNVKDPQP